MTKVNKAISKAYSWVPTLYFVEGLPYVLVVTLSTTLFKNMGLSDTDNAFYSSWFYLPWVIKPIWSPLVDAMRTKRWWILSMQSVLGVLFALLAFTMPTPFWFQSVVALFWVMAFFSATHDIAADGFYILALDSHDQAFYVGVRSTFYRIATIFAQGALVILSGWIYNGAPLGTGDTASHLLPAGDYSLAWAIVFGVVSILLALAALYHIFALPRPQSDRPADAKQGAGVMQVLRGFANTFMTFIRKPQIVFALLFMLLFRFPEAQLTKLASPFMLADISDGGLGLSNEDIGLAYGTIGIIGLTLGGLLGGFVVARHGLRRWLWPMVLSISLPDAVYIYMSMTQTQSLWIIDSCVFVEQLGYGFGFTAYMLYLVYFSRGENSTSVYALCTGLMALGMMLPGMIAGWMADTLGYTNFFIWVMGCCAITFIVSAFLKIDPEYGKKEKK